MLVRVVSKLGGLRGSIGGGLFTYEYIMTVNRPIIRRFAFCFFAAVFSSGHSEDGFADFADEP